MSIEGRSFVWGFVRLLVIAIVFAALYLLVDYLAALWAFPALLVKVLYTLLVIGAFIVGIDALLGLVGRSFIVWCLLIALTVNGCSKPHETTPFELEMREGHLKVEQSIKALENRVDNIEMQCKIKKAA